jgi:predicted MFS family arabinose efflux permease
MAWTTTGMAAGVAAGAAVAGQVIDAAGGRAGFYVPLGAGLLTALVAFVGRAPARPDSAVATSSDDATELTGAH